MSDLSKCEKKVPYGGIESTLNLDVCLSYCATSTVESVLWAVQIRLKEANFKRESEQIILHVRLAFIIAQYTWIDLHLNFGTGKNCVKENFFSYSGETCAGLTDEDEGGRTVINVVVGIKFWFILYGLAVSGFGENSDNLMPKLFMEMLYFVSSGKLVGCKSVSFVFWQCCLRLT